MKNPQVFFTLAFILLLATLISPVITHAASKPHAGDVVQGELIISVAEDEKGKQPIYTYYIRSNDEYLALSKDLSKEVAGLAPHSQITIEISSVRRTSLKKSASVVSSVIEGKLKNSSAPLHTEFTNNRTAFILFNFQDDTSEPFNEGNITQWTYTDNLSARQYWQKVSGQSVYLRGHHEENGDFYGYYTLPINSSQACTTVNLLDLANLATSAATLDGYNSSDYEHTVFFFPESPCHFATATDIYVWLSGTMEYDHWKEALTHELGHNLGLSHAKRLICRDDNLQGPLTTLNSNCTQIDYGDFFNIMANHVDQELINTAERLYLNFPNTRVQDVGSAGTYTLSAVETDVMNDSLPAALRIPIKYNSQNQVIEDLYLELRTPELVFENPTDFTPVKPGIIAYTVKHPTNHYTRLLNLFPEGDNSYDYNAHLAKPEAGQVNMEELGLSFSIQHPYEGRVGTARVTVDPGEACYVDYSDIYLIPLDPVIPGDTVRFEIGVTNQDSSSCGTSAYSLTVDEMSTGYNEETTLVVNPEDLGTTIFTLSIPEYPLQNTLDFQTLLRRNIFESGIPEYYMENTFEIPIEAIRQISNSSSDLVEVSSSNSLPTSTTADTLN